MTPAFSRRPDRRPFQPRKPIQAFRQATGYVRQPVPRRKSIFALRQA